MKGSKQRTRNIKVGYLARVEGEGGLWLKIRGDQVVGVKLEIFEPPRFFEAFLKGREYTEVPDIVARICGICPVAYQMSAVHALENALGIEVTGPLRELRRLIYCGEWIESHALHIYMLHAPDFLGYEDAIQMARDEPERVKAGLELKKIGNEIIRMLGGREIHPINVRIGGFYRVPTRAELALLKDPLERARDIARETVQWTANLDFPEFEQDYEFVAVHHSDEYPMNEGRIASTRGLDISARDYEAHFAEEHVAHSTALHSTVMARGPYFVGPLARYNLNRETLSPLARETARSAGFPEYCRNPFQSIVARSIEVLYACDEALRIVEEYRAPEAPAVALTPEPATGFACTEAPRGLLYHRYRIGEDGAIAHAKIVPPTSQNQKIIEDDLRQFAQKNHTLPDKELQWKCEQAIRNYDPCISCSTHFLKLHVERS